MMALSVGQCSRDVKPLIESSSLSSLRLSIRRRLYHPLREEHRVVYSRERGNYSIPRIVQSPYIRKLRDFIDGDNVNERSTEPKESKPENQCMVFEWMDADLWQLPSESFRSSSKLPRIVTRSVLEALAVLDELGGVHTGLDLYNSPFDDHL
jgi:hypothetical protein